MSTDRYAEPITEDGLIDLVESSKIQYPSSSK